MKKVLLSLLFFVALFARADGREWTDDERKWGYSLLASTIIDYSQTRYVAKNETLFWEKNLVLGHSPSIGKVNMYFASVIPVGYFLLNEADENRKNYLMVLTAVEVITISNNAKKGVGLNFKFGM